MHSSSATLRSAACLLLLVSSSALGFAWMRAPAPAALPNETLEQAMGQVDGSMKVLSKGVTAENRSATLEELAKLQTALMSAKAQTPDSAAAIDEKKRAAYTNDFRKVLIETLQFTLQAEVAVVDGKYKEADTLIRNKISAMKSAGHSKFKPDTGK